MSLDLNSTVLDLIKAVNKASSVPVATSSALGGIKIGYSASGANIPIELSNENQAAYVKLTETAVTEALGYVPLNDESISITSTLTSGTEIGSVKVGDTTTKLYAPVASESDNQLRQYYTHANMDVELPVIYSYNTTVSGTGDYKTTYGGVKAGFTFNPSADTLSVGNMQVTGENFYMGALSIGKGDGWVDFMFNGGDAGLYMRYDEDGDSHVDIYGDKVTINGFQPGGSGGGSNAIRTDWSSYISSGQDICFLIPDYETNENDFVGEVELWIENIDADWGDLSLFEGITGDSQLNSDNTIAIPDDCITMYIKFSFVDNYIIVQGNDTHGMSYTCGFARPIEKPSGRLFSIAIAPAGSGKFAIIGRTVEYL